MFKNSREQTRTTKDTRRFEISKNNPKSDPTMDPEGCHFDITGVPIFPIMIPTCSQYHLKCCKGPQHIPPELFPQLARTPFPIVLCFLFDSPRRGPPSVHGSGLRDTCWFHFAQELLNSRDCKPALGIAQIQLPRSQQIRSLKRAQTPFTVEAKKKDLVRERMLEFSAPGEISIPAGSKATVAANMISQVSVFGCSPGMVNKGEIDRQAMSNMRYHLSGQREVAIVTFTSLFDFASKAGFVIKEGEKFFDWCS